MIGAWICAGTLVATFGMVAAANADDAPLTNWPLPPSELEQRFANERFVIREVKGAGGGVTGASRLKIEYPDGTLLKVKWKAVPNKSGDGWNNSPRKELASYALQQWLFDEADYVVPTATPYCVGLDEYAMVQERAKPNLADTNCVLGVMAVWLEDVTAPEHMYNSSRFRSDPAYASAMADMNLLTYLVDHRDGRRGNLLLSTIPTNPRAFAVDNGIAFDPFPWNFLIRNWNKVRVPWLRAGPVERLRKVTPEMVDRLGVVTQMQADDKGILHLVANGPNANSRKGARVGKGAVQFGLTKSEIHELQERIEDLLEEVDEGDIRVRP